MPTATNAPVIERPPIPARLLVPCSIWVDAPDYGLTAESPLEEIQAAFEDAAMLYTYNRAGAIECQRRNGDLIEAVKRRE